MPDLTHANWSKFFNKAELLLTDRRLYEAIGAEMVADTEENFYTQADPDGRPWAKLSKKTVKRRGHSKIGIATGRLLRSMTYSVIGNTIHWGTNVLYGYWFHHGTKAKGKVTAKPGKAFRFKTPDGTWIFRKSFNHTGMTARPFLGIGDRAERLLKRLVGDKFGEAFGYRQGGNS